MRDAIPFPAYRHPGYAANWLAQFIAANETFGIAVHSAQVLRLHCELFLPSYRIDIDEQTHYLVDDLHFGRINTCDLSALLLRSLTSNGLLDGLDGTAIQDTVQSFGNPGWPTAMEAMHHTLASVPDSTELAYLLSDQQEHTRAQWQDIFPLTHQSLQQAFLDVANSLQRI